MRATKQIALFLVMLPALSISATAAEEPVGYLDFTLPLTLENYKDCVIKFNLIDQYAAEMNATENVNGNTGSERICRAIFPDLSSYSSGATGESGSTGGDGGNGGDGA